MASGGPMTSRAGRPAIPLYHPPGRRPCAEALGRALELREAATPPAQETGFHLWLADDHLELRRPGDSTGAWIDRRELQRRAKQAGELVRACGRGGGRVVLDALSGWGVDGLVLARRGHRVVMVERHPAVHALQRDLASRSGISGATCVLGDGFELLRERGRFDVVYLDPMFPPRRKSALPGKRMQWLAELTAPDERPLSRWVEEAMACARERVVLKRRRRDTAVRPPHWSIVGRTVRYDVYRGYDSCSTA